MEFSGIILAGGSSKRFGFNKVKIKFEKIPLLISQVFKIKFFCNEILVSTSGKNYRIVKKQLEKIDYYYDICNLKKLDKILPVKIILDEEKQNSINFKDIGPIAGIYKGLKNSQNFFSIVLAFDMPFISHNLLSLLINYAKKSDVVIINRKKGYEALCGIYSKNCLEMIEKNIGKKRYKISDIFYNINVRKILENELDKKNIDKLNFFNINTLADYDKFKKILKEEELKYGSANISSGGCKKWENFFYRKIGNRT